MTFWHSFLWILIVFGASAALYQLHRLGLWLDERGWLYYKYKKSSRSAGGCFIALEQVLEPPIQHVLHVKEEKRYQAEEERTDHDDSSQTEAQKERP